MTANSWWIFGQIDKWIIVCKWKLQSVHNFKKEERRKQGTRRQTKNDSGISTNGWDWAKVNLLWQSGCTGHLIPAANTGESKVFYYKM